MKSPPISFQEANENLKWIGLVGLALGIANFALGTWPTLGQSIVQSMVMSLVIGYSIFLIIFNLPHFVSENISDFKKQLLFLFAFCLLGLVGSEIEALVRTFLFQQGEYHFLGGGGIYLFNAILTSILGFGTNKWLSVTKIAAPQIEDSPPLEISNTELLTTIPIKQGENISLHSLESILYFEAYDNYSFLFDLEGKKHLCNYSLLFLEKKLPPNFIRIHRKHLINKNQISQIKPHLKGRYVLVFKDKKQSSITSSNSYTEVIKSLIKL